jgi:hypothetical protein
MSVAPGRYKPIVAWLCFKSSACIGGVREIRNLTWLRKDKGAPPMTLK